MNNSNIVIRPLLPSDRVLVQDFFDNMGERSASFFNVNHGNEIRTLDYLDNGRPNHLFWLAEAEENGKTVMAGLLFLWDIHTTAAWLGVAVRDSFQGKRLGQRLLETAFDYCKEQGIGCILLRTKYENIPAQKLYERCGFGRIGHDGNGEYLYIKRFERTE